MQAAFFVQKKYRNKQLLRYEWGTLFYLLGRLKNLMAFSRAILR